MALKGAVFVRFSAFMVVHALGWGCGATLSRQALRGCGSLGFRVDDGAAGQVVRFRWETSTPEANN